MTLAPVVEVVGELFMLVLSVIAAPSDLKEFRLDVVQHSGRVETLIVRRTDAGFTLLERQGGKDVETGTIRPVAGRPATYALRLGNGPEQTFDFAASIRDFSVDALLKAQTLDLRAGDGAVIHLCRSGNAVYLTPAKGRATYACH